jgi:hypothetical protein
LVRHGLLSLLKAHANAGSPARERPFAVGRPGTAGCRESPFAVTIDFIMDTSPDRPRWSERALRQLPFSIGAGVVLALFGYLWAQTSNAADRYFVMGMGLVWVFLGLLMYAVALWFKHDDDTDSTTGDQ